MQSTVFNSLSSIFISKHAYPHAHPDKCNNLQNSAFPTTRQELIGSSSSLNARDNKHSSLADSSKPTELPFILASVSHRRCTIRRWYRSSAIRRSHIGTFSLRVVIHENWSRNSWGVRLRRRLKFLQLPLSLDGYSARLIQTASSAFVCYCTQQTKGKTMQQQSWLGKCARLSYVRQRWIELRSISYTVLQCFYSVRLFVCFCALYGASAPP